MKYSILDKKYNQYNMNIFYNSNLNKKSDARFEVFISATIYKSKCMHNESI